ncbi:mismatch repair protein [Acidicapsa dinghuensis]|uniref:Mismatch repair protein n=1 Tax=Acidicapsa dinghuensis TaxID=2218256 RepID=A0ABW1ED52_9BACT|nr:mismatch repair protein [Acidicapsa dinghuensis]
MAWSSFYHHYSSPLLIVIPAVLFVITSVIHERVLRHKSTAIRAAEVYRKGLARIEDRWPRTTERVVPAELIEPSMYARDLDMVGKGSLFELLCVARTRMGEQRLLEWLLKPAPLETIYRRQHAVTELRDQLDFRERMAVSGEDVSTGVKPEGLREWAGSSSGSMRPWLRWVAAGLAILAICGAFLWLNYGLFLPLLGILFAEWCLARLLRNQITAVLRGTDKAFETLKLFSALLRELEQQTFQMEYLNEIKRDLLSHRIAASDAIAGLGTLVSYKDSLNSLMGKILDRTLMCSLQLALAVQRWRADHGSAVGVWLDVLGEFEALLSIAGYSYEHPDDPFPSFVDGPASFEAHEIGHPLIPSHVCVRNSLKMDWNTKVLLISGSNMSGKSTLMRTVGTNTVLAMCGAPVRAKQLQLTPLRVGTSLLVNDSLTQGTSRFYAEIKRLQQICELARQDGLPVLFLLDELLQGTNSSDRLIGALGIIRELMQSGAIGILTTHDLSLTAIENGDGWIKNMHFQDSISNGKMQFDFRLRDGVVTKSNGVELMRLIGLNV